MTTALWSFPAIPQTVPEARRAIRELAVLQGAESEVQDAMALCVTEAVTNAVVHAYRDADRPGSVEVEATRVDEALCVYVRDEGRGLSPSLESRGLGLGLALMASLAEWFEVRTASGGGTEIVLRFRVTLG